MKITIMGALPPVKGPSDYCMEHVKALSKRVKMFFIDFKSIYLKFLYPKSPKKIKIKRYIFAVGPMITRGFFWRVKEKYLKRRIYPTLC